jgi:type I restriction enzyme S subunit
VRLVEVAHLRSGIAVEHGDELPKGDLPYVKVADLSLEVNRNGIVSSSRFVSQKYGDATVDVESIVFPKRGGAIATNRKRLSLVPIVCDSNLMAMKVFLAETRAFLQLWFNGFDLWKLNSGTSVPQINNKDLYPLLVPLPPLGEQHRIVAKVDELMAVCDRLESQLTTARTESRRLLEAVLHEALASGSEACNREGRSVRSCV